ncbi:MAG TPA: hypothetical protein VF784_02220 [Anaerolineales bacterium]
MSASFLRKSGWVAAGLVIVAVGSFYTYKALAGSRLFLPFSTAVVAAPVGDLPNIPQKQTPASFVLDGCPPTGRGGDAELNMLKNRTDPGNYQTVSFDSLTTLTWPKNVENVPMLDWPAESRSFIAQYEGMPIEVEGYLIGLKEGYPDPADCNWDSSSYLDWHISFAQNARDDRAQSILVEVTPRIRMRHRWTIDAIHALLIDVHVPARLSGWLYFDPEHPGDVGVTRASLWEINPVMQIEVFDKNRWVPLDTLAR